MGGIIKTLKSGSFFEKVALLIVTAGLSGFLIPVIMANIAHKTFQEEKLFEAELARQTKIIESQVKLLEDLADLLWEYQLLAIDVSFYHQFKKSNNLYIAAAKNYDEKAGAILGKIRAEVSKALRLTSPETYQKLKNLYYKELLRLDLRLRNLIDGRASDWSDFNQYAVYNLSEIVDNVLNDLAKELQLKGRNTNSRGAHSNK